MTKFGNFGFSNNSVKKRQEHDYYATSEPTVKALLDKELFDTNIWEPACGEGHISKILEDYLYNAKSTDLIDRNYGLGNVDFLKEQNIFKGGIITNPPYNLAMEFIEHSLSLVETGSKCAFLLRLQFLEGQKRYSFFNKKKHFKKLYVNSSRVIVYPNGSIENTKGQAIAFAWFIFEKDYEGEATIDFLKF